MLVSGAHVVIRHLHDAQSDSAGKPSTQLSPHAVTAIALVVFPMLCFTPL